MMTSLSPVMPVPPGTVVLDATPAAAAAWLRQHGQVLQTDSRRIRPGDVFLAWPGAAHDARQYVPQALQQGAAACLIEAQAVNDCMALAQLTAPQRQRVACYPRLKADTGAIAAAFYGEPSRQQVQVLAVTGTNGKTSTAWWLAQALARQQAAGAGMAGTLGIGRFKQSGQADLADTGLTTPDPVRLQSALRQMADQGVPVCVMEASSIGLEEQRLAGTHIHTAIFTNFTQDHLDYHGSMQAYWRAKRALFDWPGLACAIVNIDDPRGAALAAKLRGRSGLDVWTLSCQPAAAASARLYASAIRYGAQGLVCDVHERQGVSGSVATETMHTGVIGEYNISNLLGVLAALRTRGWNLSAAVQACASLQPVPGRMQCLGRPGTPLVVVDYAHTPDALEKALAALRPLARQRQGRLWAVFGCGGDRDPGKRPLMGRVAQQGADQLLLTSDNPRSEDPQRILADICAGLPHPRRVQIQPDRARAIRQAVAAAAAADVVLVAGKGHEDYQDIQGQRLPFSDQAHVQAAVQAWGARHRCGGGEQP